MDFYIEIISNFVVFALIPTYFALFSKFYIHPYKKRKRLSKLYNAIKSTYNRKRTNPNLIDELNMINLKLCQEYKIKAETSLFEGLESLIYCYSTYTDEYFKSIFRTSKDTEIIEFITLIKEDLKEKEPFSMIPYKEAGLLNEIKNALTKNNIELGTHTLSQLSTELINKEKLLHKKEKENSIATILSIVGIVLTIFFGLLSFRG